MSLGAVNFSFQGGEPLLYPDLKDYIKAAQPHRNLISVTTNGTLLTYKKAKELKSWGVDILTLSMDPFREPQWRAINIALGAGLKVTLATVVTHEDFDYINVTGKTLLADLIQYASKNKIILMLIFAVPMGQWQGRSDIMLTPSDVSYVRNLCKKNPYIRTDFQANYIHEGCGAAKEILYINPYGDMFACPFLPISFGNVRFKAVKKIREKMLCLPMFQKYQKTCIAGEGNGLWGKFSSPEQLGS